jgi:hypothetical protein
MSELLQEISLKNGGAVEPSSTPDVEDVAGSIGRSVFPEIQQFTNRARRTGIAADFTGDL